MKLISNNYRADIDGLRGIAVLAVVLFHAYPDELTGGFVGVDIFFVISGFLISGIIFEALENNTFSFVDFYLKRIRRIFPALILTLLCTFAFGWFVLLADEYAQLGKHIASAAGFVSNLMLINESGYFDNSADTKPLLHLWSLGVEEQFYIFWPLLLWAAHVKRFKSIPCIISIVFISFLYSIYATSVDTTYAFYSPFTRCWELLIGAVVAHFYVRIKESALGDSNLLSNLKSLSGLLLIGVGICCFKNDYGFPGYWALLPVVGASLVIYAGPRTWFNRNILANKVVVWFGLISYPLYLWHWPILSFARITESTTPKIHIRFQLILLSVFMAYLTYKWVEKPFRAKGISKKRGITTVLIMAVIGGVGLCTFTVWDGLKNRAFVNAVNPEYVKAINDWDFPKGLKERSVDATKYFINFEAALPAPEILFVGDSHIEQFAPRIVELSKNKEFKSVALLSTSGQPPLSSICKLPQNECGSALDDANKLLERFLTIKTVVIGFCWNCYFVNDVENDNGRYFIKQDQKSMFYKGEGSRLALESLKESLTKLSKRYKVYLLLDNPYSSSFNPRNLLGSSADTNRLFFLQGNQAGNSHLSLTQGERISEKQDSLNLLLKELAVQSGAIPIDQLKILCPDEICRITEKGKPIYLDEGHLRPYFVIESGKYLDAVFE